MHDILTSLASYIYPPQRDRLPIKVNACQGICGSCLGCILCLNWEIIYILGEPINFLDGKNKSQISYVNSSNLYNLWES